MRRYTKLYQSHTNRRGTISALAAVTVVAALAFAMFTVDVGYLTLALAELENAADASALAGAAELSQSLGVGATEQEAEELARQAAKEVAAANPAADRDSVYLDSVTDVRLGQLQWNEQTQGWEKLWGVQPYTLVEVSVHRDRGSNSSVPTPDGPIPLFFGPIFQHSVAGLNTRSASAIYPAGGIRIDEESNQTADVLPITFDVESWDAMLDGEVYEPPNNGNGGGSTSSEPDDDYSYNSALDKVVQSPDGIYEVNLYPGDDPSLPPGNRGQVDIGHPGNSTADLKRQITDGVNGDDLSYHGGEIRWDEPLSLNGDTGVSAGIESALVDQIGQVKLMPLFSAVSGNGNNAQYTMDRFVGVRIMAVKLTGPPSQRHIIVQPTPYSSSTVVRSRTEIREDSVFTKPGLVR